MPDEKTLYLVRHADSDWNTGDADFDRPLNARGLRDAPEMGKRLRERCILPELIISSPAQRARETTRLIAGELGIAHDAIIFEPAIYEASIYSLAEIILNIEESTTSVMLVGHNPAMTWLANQLSGNRIQNMPTTAIATIGLAAGHWRDIDKGEANLLDFDFPKNPEH